MAFSILIFWANTFIMYTIVPILGLWDINPCNSEEFKTIVFVLLGIAYTGPLFVGLFMLFLINYFGNG